MYSKIRHLLIASLSLLAACSQNPTSDSNSQNNQAPISDQAANRTPSFRGIPPDRSLAQLLEEIAKTPSNERPFMCEFAIVGEAQDFRDLKKLWISKAEDSRYRVDQCVCPCICLIALTDRKKPLPANSELLIIAGNYGAKGQPRASFKWLATDIDLTNAALNWASSSPTINFRNSNGDTTKMCLIDWEENHGKYEAGCGDGHGHDLPLQ